MSLSCGWLIKGKKTGSGGSPQRRTMTVVLVVLVMLLVLVVLWC